MTVKERVLASRLIQKIENNESYARQIGLSFPVSMAGATRREVSSFSKKIRKTDYKGE